MHPRIGGPAKHEEAGGGQQGAQDGGREAKLWLAGAADSGLALVLANEAGADAVPQGIGRDAQQHGDHDAKKGQARLPDVEAVVVAEDEGKGAEEEIENAEQDCREEAEVETHGLEEEELEGPQQRAADGAGHGLLDTLRRGGPPAVAGLLPECACLVPEQDGVCRDTRKVR